MHSILHQWLFWLALSAPAHALELTPIQLSERLSLRDQTGLAFLHELGVTINEGHFARLDGNLGYSIGRPLGMPGPVRDMGSVELSAEASHQVGPWARTGPTLGGSFRFFRQQWMLMSIRFVPIVGWGLGMDVVRARTWSVGLTAKAMVDLVPVEMVRETAEIVNLSPFEGQVGLNFRFGGRL